MYGAGLKFRVILDCAERARKATCSKGNPFFCGMLDMFLSMYCICLAINFCSNKTLHMQGSKINFWVVKYVSYPGVSCMKTVLLQVLKV